MFVPGLIFNNKKEDAEKLARFKEPSWNNPVIRLLTHDFKDIVGRKDGIWSTGDVTNRIIETLKATKRKVPECLKLVQLENSKKTEFATFAMHCYWEGEIQFGQLPGVKETQSAWYDGKEIVNVAFDPSVSSYEQVLKLALKVRCASTIYARDKAQSETARKFAADRVETIGIKEYGRPAKASDQKYYLEGSPIRYVPMTKTQRVRVNSALGRRNDPARYLTSKQVEISKWIQKNRENRSLINDLQVARSKLDLVDYSEFVKQRMKKN